MQCFGDPPEAQPLSRIKKRRGTHLQGCWLNIPHVTQFDEADIGELEAFRTALKEEAQQQGLRLTPEVAILGLSRSKMQPVWNGREFAPRLILPFSVSYDHRVIDGVQGVRFTTLLARLLGDIRRLLL